MIKEKLFWALALKKTRKPEAGVGYLEEGNEEVSRTIEAPVASNDYVGPQTQASHCF